MPTVEDVAFAKRLPEYSERIESFLWGTGESPFTKDELREWAAWSREQLERPTTDRQLREENEQLRKRLLIELREENERLQRIIRFGLSVINKRDAELQRLRDVAQEIYWAITQRHGRETSEVTRRELACTIPRLEAALGIAPPTEAEKGTSGK